MDTIPPEILHCPDDIEDTIQLGGIHRTIKWTEPEALDISNNVSLIFQSHSSGDNFSLGTTDVSYTFVDESGNTEFCNFTIILSSGKAFCAQF